MEVFLQGKGLLKLTQMKGLVIYALYYEIESWSQMRVDLRMEALQMKGFYNLLHFAIAYNWRNFSRFKVSEVRKMYAHAIEDLSASCSKHSRQNNDGARVGEEGALGWSTWLDKEEETRPQLMNEELSRENEGGGWTGWSEPWSKDNEGIANVEHETMNDVVMENIQDEEEY
ncbi:hypothetical protein JHK85_032439 [Glycine max]|nr:hypothetical protein JHK85_032439 [Glycine max]